MKKGPYKHLSTTALVSTQFNRLPPNISRTLPSQGNIISGCSFSNCGTGIVQVKRHQAPKIDDESLQMIEADQPEYITRHIEERWLEATLKGYFRFGTLVNYRAAEGAIGGRLGDHQESRIQETFNSRSSFFESASLKGIEISNTSFSGTKNHIVIETIVNDFCSCASVGKFATPRAEAIRDAEDNPEKRPSAYVTYHLATLRKAISENLSQTPGLSNLTPLGRTVEYGEKDQRWKVEENFSYKRDRDALATWLGIAFVKSPTFKHEEEYRLLLIDRSGPGALNDKTETYEIPESTRIAESIFAHGTF
ncbi:hypothetical protein [Litorisediminicola beolgyonensis]|uniref:Uncharacterized protein n=1 Tax=Litorisediminicola beolgyonensis TaxID=1173614 RepID=A0ABW3ZLK9_9RHOB